jgi:hypothetical protein
MTDYTQEISVPELGVTVTITVRAIVPPPPPPPPAEPNLVVTGFTVTPAAIPVGAAYTATATVVNEGGDGFREILIGYLLADGTKKPLNAADPGRLLTLAAGATGTVVWVGKGSTKGAWTFYCEELTAVLSVGDTAPSVKAYDATFTVTDKDSHALLKGAKVTVGTLSGVTDAAGKATLGPVNAGTYAYKVALAGYDPIEGSFTAG